MHGVDRRRRVHKTTGGRAVRQVGGTIISDVHGRMQLALFRGCRGWARKGAWLTAASLVLSIMTVLTRCDH